jgi:transposase-like protein
LECPSCRKLFIVKSGRNKSGTQRYYCKFCKAYFTFEDAWTLKHGKYKNDVLYLYFSSNYGLSFRFIAKKFQLHHQTVKTLVDTELQSLRKKAGDLAKRGLSSDKILSEMARESPDGFLARLVREAKEKECASVLQIIMEEQPKPKRESAIEGIERFQLKKMPPA